MAYAVADVQLLLEVAESVHFKRISDNSVLSVFWRTRARIVEAQAEAVVNNGHGNAANVPAAANRGDIYETYARAHSNLDSFALVAIEVDAEYDMLLHCLPPRIAVLLKAKVPAAESQLMDVVMDLKRPVSFIRSDGPDVRVEVCIVTEDDIAFVLDKCGPITDSNRACVGSSLHRCSVIRDPHSEEVIGHLG